MRVTLIEAGPTGRRIVFDALPAMIGRDEAAEICIADSWVGRYQCIIDRDGDKLRVLDLGSRNGTFVNGVRIQRAELKQGDTLSLGRTDFVVQYERITANPSFNHIVSATATNRL